MFKSFNFQRWIKYNVIFQKYSKGLNHLLSMYRDKLISKVYLNFKEK